jgi:uncharacterized protein HemX
MPSAEFWSQFPVLAVAVLLAGAILFMQERRDEKQNAFNERMAKLREDEQTKRDERNRETLLMIQSSQNQTLKEMSSSICGLTEALAEMAKQQTVHNTMSMAFMEESRSNWRAVVPPPSPRGTGSLRERGGL